MDNIITKKREAMKKLADRQLVLHEENRMLQYNYIGKHLSIEVLSQGIFISGTGEHDTESHGSLYLPDDEAKKFCQELRRIYK